MIQREKTLVFFQSILLHQFSTFSGVDGAAVFSEMMFNATERINTRDQYSIAAKTPRFGNFREKKCINRFLMLQVMGRKSNVLALNAKVVVGGPFG